MKLKDEHIHVLLYFAFAMILLWYLINVRFKHYPHVSIFWISIIVMLSLIAYQIIKLDENTNQHLRILLQILIFVLIIRLVYTPTTGLFGHDPYREYAVAREILKNGWSLSTVPRHLGGNEHSYPMVHFLGIISSKITGLDLFTVANWFPNFYSLPTILFIYILTFRVYNSKKAGLLASFGFGMLNSFVMFHSLFHRETIAFVMFIAAIYSYYIARRYKKQRYPILALLFFATCILAHHLTSFFLILFFILFYAIQKMLSIIQTTKSTIPKRIFKSLEVEKEQFTVFDKFMLLIILCISCFIIYVGLPHSHLINVGIREFLAFDPFALKHELSIAIPEILRYKILLIGEITFALIFGVISIYAIFLRGEKRTNLDVTFLAWGALIGIGSLLLFQSKDFGHICMVSRYLTFAYVPLFILSGYATSQKIKEKKRIGVILLVIFLIFASINVYRIPPYLYTENEPNYKLGEGRAYTLPQEYSAIFWFDGNGELATDNQIRALLISLRGINAKTNMEVLRGDFTNIQKFNYIFLRREITYQMDEKAYTKYNTIPVDRIYDNGVVEIHHIFHNR